MSKTLIEVLKEQYLKDFGKPMPKHLIEVEYNEINDKIGEQKLKSQMVASRLRLGIAK